MGKFCLFCFNDCHNKFCNDTCEDLYYIELKEKANCAEDFDEYFSMVNDQGFLHTDLSNYMIILRDHVSWRGQINS